ncbi:MAG: hypothetical protein AABP62_08345 [Planctomycetota bacterium]
MFKALRWVLAGMVLQLMVGQAFAQGGRGGVGAISGTTLVQQKSVQDELKLSADQIEKLKQVGAKLRESFGGGGGDREEARKKFEEARQTADKDVAGILSADQSKRLKEIVLQQAGPLALARPEVAKEVGLSDDQQVKVKEIADGFTSALREQFRGAGGDGNREEARKKFETLRKDTGDKVLALLKDDQKKAWEKLVGEPFKGEIQPFGGNRPRSKNAQ